MSLLSPGQIAQIACLLEATARKPGNVHRFQDFNDTHYLDFLLSASAIVGPLDRARVDGVGAAILAAVEATRGVVRSNTNLGMILLLAPLAAVLVGIETRAGVAEVLQRLTVQDASATYRAIRRAQPGGLGSADDQDVAAEPTVTLLQAMELATDRDGVARQYANGYREVFEVAHPALRSHLEAGHAVETAVIAAHLALLAAMPDTLIARKRGHDTAVEASTRAAEVLAAGWPEAEPGSAAIADFDRWLRADGHARNPGTTADLVTAALFVALRDGTIPLPIDRFAEG